MLGETRIKLDRAARSSVLRRLSKAHDRFAEQHQLLVASGDWAEAEGAHQMCLRLLRAYVAEMDDPKPEGLA